LGEDGKGILDEWKTIGCQFSRERGMCSDQLRAILRDEALKLLEHGMKIVEE